MRYYELDSNGRIKGDYAVEQLGKKTYRLEEPDIPFPMRNGVPGEKWIIDPVAETEAARQTEKKEKEERAKNELTVLIASQQADEDRITLKDLIERIKKIENILGFGI